MGVVTTGYATSFFIPTILNVSNNLSPSYILTNRNSKWAIQHPCPKFSASQSSHAPQ